MTQFAFSPLSAEERKAVRLNWARLHPTSTASDYILRSFLLGTDLSKHFSPVTNSIKLNNGAKPYAGALKAAQQLRRRANLEVYRKLMGLTQTQLEEPELHKTGTYQVAAVHAERLRALEAWSREISDISLPGTAQ